MKHKLGVCVPYRNRETHLNIFIPYITNYLKNRDIDFQIYIAHQTDDKLFNRGAMKNIAAEWAFKDGCDYIVWHDIDMLPEEGCDYSYPEEHPTHIATKISQMDYKLKYYEYFGGAVLFTKEQVERTNGYSNDYWDWGMEDDDLFWRCVLEDYVDKQYLEIDLNDYHYLHFDGSMGAVIEYTDKLKDLTTKSHTISVLTRAYQQPDKQPIYLIGDETKQYVEYPIVRIPGYDYGVSFNNSRTFTFQCWDDDNTLNYMWAKRYDKEWSWITVSVDTTKNQMRFYMNGEELDHTNGHGSQSPHKFKGPLKNYGDEHIYLGFTPSLEDDNVSKFFKGDLAKVLIWDRVLTNKEIKNLHLNTPTDGKILDLNDDNNSIHLFGAAIKSEDIKIQKTVLPHRKEGRFLCLPHEDLGLTEDGNWKQGKTTARNEKKYVLEMQEGISNYKTDGMNSLKYELVSVDELSDCAKMLNVRL